MSDAVQKTQNLKRLEIAVELIDTNTDNPNTMSDEQFNLLCDNIEKTGITDPILVRAIEGDRYRVIGGHHRLEVAKLLGFPTVPCTIIDDPDFTEEDEAYQVVRMNMIRGRMDPNKFIKLYEKVKGDQQQELLAHSFGFADAAEFERLIGEVKKSLPKELQKEFAKASEELKTIEDLSKVLNRLFTKYGDTLPYGYMYFDFGGKDSIWLRMHKPTKTALEMLGDLCKEKKRTMDDLLGGLIRKAATGQLDDVLMQLIADTPEVEIPAHVKLPTQENLQVA